METIANLDNQLFSDLARIIEQGRNEVARQVNSTLTFVYWQLGKKINEHILDNQRGAYGKQIVVSVARQLENQYGRSFNEKNVRRMMQFAEVFPDSEIVVPLARQLTWSHLIILLPLKNSDARLFYAQRAIDERLGKRDLRKQIEQKAFERTEIANLQIATEISDLQHTFKDPYFLDFLGLKDGYLENDVETAILKELENFILELGTGFTFVERQKRMIIDEEDYYLDLLFFHRKLKRLVAIELKIGKFKAKYKGQMELYLKWLDKYDKQEGENSPIGLILCAGKSDEQIELLQMHKDGIMVAEYWTELPPRKELEKKLHQILIEAKERVAQRKIYLK
jgi:predicted nuclease of restriction endonuclease-like (RecB) superfamily